MGYTTGGGHGKRGLPALDPFKLQGGGPTEREGVKFYPYNLQKRGGGGAKKISVMLKRGGGAISYFTFISPPPPPPIPQKINK